MHLHFRLPLSLAELVAQALVSINPLCAAQHPPAAESCGLCVLPVLPLSLPQVIQLQGDQRKNVLEFLTKESLVKKDLIKIHGF